MQFMLLVCTDPEAETYVPAEDNVGEWGKEMADRGIALHGDRLRPVEDATTVRVRGGQTIVTDGPFAETRERIAGYDIIECTDLDEAIEVTAKHPMARFGRIEIRPVWPFEEDS